ncbi:MAG: DUF3078 domain-containing protein [Balneolaceae bacterium]
MKRIQTFVLLFLFLSVYSAYAQQTELLAEIENPNVPDTLTGWDVNWTLNLNGAQASYSNWAKGGSNSVSINGASLFQLLYRQDRFAYEFWLRGRYGQTRIKDEGVRKTDDRLALRNRFLYDLSKEHNEFKIFTNLNFETQFDKGYDFRAGPEGEDVLISDFFAPAYFVQNAGLAYYPERNVSIETGLGLKQTVVREPLLSTRYGLDEGQRFKSEAGYTFGMNVQVGIMENVVYTGYLETFSNLLKPVSSTDIFITNEFVGKINNFLNATFQFNLIFDDDFSNEMQVSQLLSAGVSVSIF